MVEWRVAEAARGVPPDWHETREEHIDRLRNTPTHLFRLRFFGDRSPKTIKCYVGHVMRFARHFGCSPERLGPEEARQYQLHLLERKVGWSSFNQSVCALRFLYGTTLGRVDFIPRLTYGRRPKKLPVVLDRQEVLELLSCVCCRNHRMMLTTMYATGMRIGETVELGVRDIDSRRMTILVARGKGNKQRLVPMSPVLLQELRTWWQEFGRAVPNLILGVAGIFLTGRFHHDLGPLRLVALRQH